MDSDKEISSQLDELSLLLEQMCWEDKLELLLIGVIMYTRRSMTYLIVALVLMLTAIIYILTRDIVAAMLGMLVGLIVGLFIGVPRSK